MKSYGKLTLALIAAWFLIALSASELNLFQNSLNRMGFAVALAAFTPIATFLIWFAASLGFREFTLSLSPSTLTLVHS